MIFGWIVQILLLVGAAGFGLRRAFSRGHDGESRSRQIRRFFQYLPLLALAFIAASGLTGLLGKVFDFHHQMFNDQATLATNASFVIIGLPLYVVMGLWTKRTIAADSEEANSYAFKLYLIGAASVSLVMATVAASGLLRYAFADAYYRGSNLSQFVIWGLLLIFHLRLWKRFGGVSQLLVGYLIGSFVGLTTALIGLGMLIGESLTFVFGLHAQMGDPTNSRMMREGITYMLVGIPVWIFYWLKNAYRSERNPLWLGFVILVGLGGGFSAAITSISIGLYQVLVWFFGDTNSETAKVYFQQSPAAVAGFITGFIVWLYHRKVLAIHHLEGRNEVRRIYDYLLAGIGLIVSTVGTTMVVVSIIESIAMSTAINGDSPINALIASITMMIVGGALWLTRWRAIQTFAATDADHEIASPSRRIYLYLLFGAFGVMGVVVLIVATSFFLQDLFQGVLGRGTAQRVRFPVAMLFSSIGVSFYHWGIFRSDQRRKPAKIQRLKEIHLVGPSDSMIGRLLAEKTGAKVDLLVRTDAAGGEWNVDRLVELATQASSTEILILCDIQGMHVIPIASK